MTVALGLANNDDFHERLALIEPAIAFVVKRYCRSVEEAEDFSSHAWVTVLEGDFTIVSSTPPALLIALIRRILLDYRRSVRV
jgi:DNA-directed RNA polymerase specialized sigma24 family protein